MTRYLEHLVGRVTGGLPTLRPRPRSRFEPTAWATDLTAQLPSPQERPTRPSSPQLHGEARAALSGRRDHEEGSPPLAPLPLTGPGADETVATAPAERFPLPLELARPPEFPPSSESAASPREFAALGDVPAPSEFGAVGDVSALSRSVHQPLPGRAPSPDPSELSDHGPGAALPTRGSGERGTPEAGTAHEVIRSVVARALAENTGRPATAALDRTSRAPLTSSAPLLGSPRAAATGTVGEFAELQVERGSATSDASATGAHPFGAPGRNATLAPEEVNSPRSGSTPSRGDRAASLGEEEGEYDTVPPVAGEPRDGGPRRRPAPVPFGDGGRARNSLALPSETGWGRSLEASGEAGSPPEPASPVRSTPSSPSTAAAATAIVPSTGSLPSPFERAATLERALTRTEPQRGRPQRRPDTSERFPSIPPALGESGVPRVTVTIGRVEVHAPAPLAPPPPVAAESGPRTLSLEDYLQRRSGPQ